MAKPVGAEPALVDDEPGDVVPPPTPDDFFASGDGHRLDAESDHVSMLDWFSDSEVFPGSSFGFLLDGEPEENGLDSDQSNGLGLVDDRTGGLAPAFEFNFWGIEEDEEEEEEEGEEGLGFGLGTASGMDPHPIGSGGDGLRVVGTDSDSEFDGSVFELNSSENIDDGVDSSFPIVWDNFFDEEDVEEGDVLDWEEVQNAINGTHDSVTVLGEELPALSGLPSSRDEDDEPHEHDLDWEVLLAVNNVVDYIEQAEGIGVTVMEDMDPDYYHFLTSHYDHGIDNGDYDAIFGHMLDDESGIRGSPPAAVRVVKNLPVVKFTVEELIKGDIACAICKEEIAVEEKVRKLPCNHFYHGECILPWLEIRNTCPVCRFELLTDDAAYERNRTRQRMSAR